MTAPDTPYRVLPFIGAFSSGKSSLINALLGDALLATDVTPETSVPLELRAAPKLAAHACSRDGKRRHLSEQQLRSGELAALVPPQGWVEASLPQLQMWPHLVLVDLPGWSSGLSEHEQPIDHYLQRLARTHQDRHLLYLLAVSADDGALRDDISARLRQIDWGQSPYVLLITKADKRHPDDLRAVVAHISAAAQQAVGKAPERVLLTSVRKNLIADLRACLEQIEHTLQAQHTRIDTAAVLRSIDAQVQALRSLLQDRRDQSVYLFDEVWDRFSDDTLDELFDELPYPVAQVRGESACAELERLLRSELARLFARQLPDPEPSLARELGKLGLRLPEKPSADALPLQLERHSQKYIRHAIDKAKPGLLSSDDPDDVGRRIRSRIRDQRSELRGIIISQAYTSLSAALEPQLQAWQRLRSLVEA